MSDYPLSAANLPGVIFGFTAAITGLCMIRAVKKQGGSTRRQPPKSIISVKVKAPPKNRRSFLC